MLNYQRVVSTKVSVVRWPVFGTLPGCFSFGLGDVSVSAEQVGPPVSFGPIPKMNKHTYIHTHIYIYIHTYIYIYTYCSAI